MVQTEMKKYKLWKMVLLIYLILIIKTLTLRLIVQIQILDNFQIFIILYNDD